MINIKESINSIELIIHIYQCILHISEKMDIDLVLYRGPKYSKKYKMMTQIDIRKIKRRKHSKQDNQLKLQNILFNENSKRINRLKLEQKRLQQTMIDEDER